MTASPRTARCPSPFFPSDDIAKIPNAGEPVDQPGLTAPIMPGDSSCVCIKPYEKGRRLGFMHIPKTAGNAMSSCLKRAIRPKTHAHVTDRSLFTGKPGFVGSEIAQVDCYLGHVSLGTLLKCCPDGQYLTVFREASCRILSHWVWWASFPDETRGANLTWLDKHRKSLIETLSDPDIGCQFDNVSLRMLVWPHRAVPDVGFINKQDDIELLQLAMDRLKRFDYMDVIENQHFKKNLSDWLGTEVQYERVNVTAAMANEWRIDLRRELTTGALEALEARSRLDRVLWTTVAAMRLPGVDLARLTRDTLITNMARYISITRKRG